MTASDRPVTGLGAPRRHLRVTDSTNLRAAALATAGAPHGTLVTAGGQSAGRGRQGRRWSAPDGRALLMSLVLRDPPDLLSLRAGVAVAAVAGRMDHGGRRATVKWPNDVLLGGHKVAGILVEGRPQAGWAILGIGLNVAVGAQELGADLAARATGLGRSPADIELALVETLRELAATLAAPAADVLRRLRERDALRGQPLRWASGSGVGAGIGDDGRLRVRTADGDLALDAGEIHLLGERASRDSSGDR